MPLFSRRRGFTIAELLVSLAIIGVLTGLMMANFSSGQRSSEVRFAAEILVNQLRELQTNALTGRLVRVCSGGADDKKVCESKNPPVACTGGTCAPRVPDGYGIHFTAGSSSFLLFDDANANGVYDAGEELRTVPYVSTGLVQLSTSLPGAPLDVVFKPPSAQILINGVAAPDTVTLTLTHSREPIQRHVNIYRITGKIDHD